MEDTAKIKFSNKLEDISATELLTSADETDYLGCGGFASVRFCRHPIKGEVVAKCFTITGTKENIEKHINDVKREAEVLARMEHPNIVKIHGFSNWDGNKVAIVLEYVECGSLDGLISSQHELSWELRQDLFGQVNSALYYLHNFSDNKFFFHGDIKPENILLDRHLNVKLADFGAVNIVRASQCDTTSLDIAPTGQHTARYAAPEVLEGKEISRLADMYSLAMVLYELVTRGRVYAGATIHKDMLRTLILAGTRPDSAKVKQAKAALTNEADRKIFTLLTELMKKCWNKDPKARPTTLKVAKKLENSGNGRHTDLEVEKRELSRLLRRVQKTSGQRTNLSMFSVSFMFASLPPVPDEPEEIAPQEDTAKPRSPSPPTPVDESTRRHSILSRAWQKLNFGTSRRTGTPETTPSPASPPSAPEWEMVRPITPSSPEGWTSLFQIGGLGSERHCAKYDVTTGAITEMPNLNEGRILATSVTTVNFVLIFGGEGDLAPLKSGEIIDVAAGTEWSPVAKMPGARMSAASAVCEELIFLSGGFDRQNRRLSTCFLYNVTKDSWSKTSDMILARSSHAMASLGGKVYSIGGWDGKSEMTSCEVYEEDQWTEAAPMLKGRQALAAVALQDCIYALGGTPNESSVERYDPRTSKWSSVQSMNVGRYDHGACVVDDKIYVVGGYDEKSVEVYDPRADKWSHLFDTKVVRNWSNVVAV